MKKFLYTYILPPIIFVLIYLICISLRVTVINRKAEEELESKGQNRLYTFWHGRLFYFPYHYRFQPQYSILVSPSQDGEIISRVLNKFGFPTIRGSSYKSGRDAFWKLSHIIKNGKSAVLIGDGSRGPVYNLQKGIVSLARHSGLPVIPMTFSAARKITLSSWDKFIIPYPFSKAVVIYGDPVYVKRTDDIEKKRQKLETVMNRIKDEADAWSYRYKS